MPELDKFMVLFIIDILVYSNSELDHELGKPYDFYCDASLGCVLMQEGRVIAYASR